MGRLSAQSSLEERIPEYTKREDRYGETIAAVEGIATEELGDSFVVVFAACGDIPECGVEDDGACSD